MFSNVSGGLFDSAKTNWFCEFVELPATVLASALPTENNPIPNAATVTKLDLTKVLIISLLGLFTFN